MTSFPQLVLIAIVATIPLAACGQSEPPIAKLKAPPGFAVSIYAEVPDARTIRWSEQDVLFVSNRRGGSVYAAVDSDSNGTAETLHEIASGLNQPNGIALLDGDLFVAEIHRILRFDDVHDRLGQEMEPVVVIDNLPDERHHGWRYIDFGPDGRLYISFGTPCNICERDEPFSTITSMQPDGSDWRVEARGIRNSVGFTWHPSTNELFFTDNGRDHLGDDLPPDELNRVRTRGEHFGYPYVHGDDILDPEFGRNTDPDDYSAPAQRLGAHVASLGLEFYQGDSFPDEFHHQLFIAEHGSWNRSSKVGYRVSLVRLNEDGEATSYETFVEGWLQDEESWGRPVDVEVVPDGSLLISDDAGGRIYRVRYSG